MSPSTTSGRGRRPRRILAAVEATGVRGVLIQADVSSAAAVAQLVDDAVKAFGRLDILVNNAGIEVHAPFWDVKESDYDKVMAVNVKGTFFGTQAFIRHLRATQRGGRSSTSARSTRTLPFRTSRPTAPARGRCAC